MLRFNPDGSFHSEYKAREANKGRDMAIPHSLVVDECDNTVTVADRENKRVVIFNLDTGALVGESQTRLAAAARLWRHVTASQLVRVV